MVVIETTRDKKVSHERTGRGNRVPNEKQKRRRKRNQREIPIRTRRK